MPEVRCFCLECDHNTNGECNLDVIEISAVECLDYTCEALDD